MNKDRRFAIVQAGLEYSLLLDNGMVSKKPHVPNKSFHNFVVAVVV